jgi:UDP-N-acetylmuramoylalanine--D-glutamate ligase
MGIPIAGEVQNTKKGDVIVSETAALQVEMIEKFRPHVCAVLNITEDHLDRFGTMEKYIAAKKRIFENQTKEDFCVLNYDNDITRAMEKEPKSKIIFFSRKVQFESGVFVKDGIIVSAESDGVHKICRADEVKMPGVHNLENALAACAMARCYNIPEEVIAKTLKEFSGVEHRIELVREFEGIRYINDSKGTNPDATVYAARAMTRPTVIILGGSEKNNSFVTMLSGFSENIKAVVAIGETKANILKDAQTAGYKNIYTADAFEEAVLKARGLAENGWNVLLSPACASYDMFDNFEHRGEVFKKIVNSF